MLTVSLAGTTSHRCDRGLWFHRCVGLTFVRLFKGFFNFVPIRFKVLREVPMIVETWSSGRGLRTSDFAFASGMCEFTTKLGALTSCHAI